ncbi:MAG: hypothetical protein LBD65_06750, partial [Spirochaetaceae bacterium]|nr:hypothetical protein [Spirochaetaceae bacterium]
MKKKADTEPRADRRRLSGRGGGGKGEYEEKSGSDRRFPIPGSDPRVRFPPSRFGLLLLQRRLPRRSGFTRFRTGLSPERFRRGVKKKVAAELRADWRRLSGGGGGG